MGKTRGPRRRAKGATEHDARRLLLALPGVEEGPCYGTPGWRVKKKFLARLKEDGDTLVVKVGDEERDILMAADPKTFFITDHYVGYPTVLVRLSNVHIEMLREVLERAWQRIAPTRLLVRSAANTRSRTSRVPQLRSRADGDRLHHRQPGVPPLRASRGQRS